MLTQLTSFATLGLRSERITVEVGSTHGYTEQNTKLPALVGAIARWKRSRKS